MATAQTLVRLLSIPLPPPPPPPPAPEPPQEPSGPGEPPAPPVPSPPSSPLPGPVQVICYPVYDSGVQIGTQCVTGVVITN